MNENGFFSNTGGFIKGYAKVSFWIMFIACFIGGIAIMVDNPRDEEILIGLGIIFVGIPAAYVLSQFIYSYGELVDAAKQNNAENEKIIGLLDELNGSTRISANAASVNTPEAVHNENIVLPNL